MKTPGYFNRQIKLIRLIWQIIICYWKTICYILGRVITRAVLTFVSLDKILRCDHSNETSLAVVLPGTVCFLTREYGKRNERVIADGVRYANFHSHTHSLPYFIKKLTTQYFAKLCYCNLRKINKNKLHNSCLF